LEDTSLVVDERAIDVEREKLEVGESGHGVVMLLAAGEMQIFE
jgi:hypothetical protein